MELFNWPKPKESPKRPMSRPASEQPQDGTGELVGQSDKPIEFVVDGQPTRAGAKLGEHVFVGGDGKKPMAPVGTIEPSVGDFTNTKYERRNAKVESLSEQVTPVVPEEENPLGMKKVA